MKTPALLAFWHYGRHGRHVLLLAVIIALAVLVIVMFCTGKQQK